jgi:presenilin-like A22 family membrane protease
MAGKSYKPVLGIMALYVASQLTGLFLSYPFNAMNIHAFSNPSSMYNVVYYIILLLAVTGIMLLIGKTHLTASIKYFMFLALGMSDLFVIYFSLYFWYPFVINLPMLYYIDVDLLVATIVTVVLITLLALYPEWYVINVVGFISASGMIAILGVSFSILPAFILLSALAIYDAISVYKTKHMLRLAEITTDLKIPAMVVVPKTEDYSYIEDNTKLSEKLESKEERESIFMGLGDIVIPGLMVVSSYAYLPSNNHFLYLGYNLWVALFTLFGSLIGMLLLFHVGKSGNPQAGLPFLNGGALVAFLISIFVFYKSFVPML